MRHGEAVSANHWRKSDAERPLAPIGIAKLEAGLKEMKRAGFSVPVIFTSPFLRAKETANLVSKVLDLSAPIVKADLASGASMDTLKKLVLSHTTPAPVLYVGHMPELALFGSRMTFEPKLLDGGLEPADILAVETGPLEKNWGEGKILWWRKISDWKEVTA